MAAGATGRKPDFAELHAAYKEFQRNGGVHDEHRQGAALATMAHRAGARSFAPTWYQRKLEVSQQQAAQGRASAEQAALHCLLRQAGVVANEAPEEGGLCLQMKYEDILAKLSDEPWERVYQDIKDARLQASREHAARERVTEKLLAEFRPPVGLAGHADWTGYLVGSASSERGNFAPVPTGWKSFVFMRWANLSSLRMAQKIASLRPKSSVGRAVHAAIDADWRERHKQKKHAECPALGKVPLEVDFCYGDVCLHDGRGIQVRMMGEHFNACLRREFPAHCIRRERIKHGFYVLRFLGDEQDPAVEGNPLLPTPRDESTLPSSVLHDLRKPELWLHCAYVHMGPWRVVGDEMWCQQEDPDRGLVQLKSSLQVWRHYQLFDILAGMTDELLERRWYYQLYELVETAAVPARFVPAEQEARCQGEPVLFWSGRQGQAEVNRFLRTRTRACLI